MSQFWTGLSPEVQGAIIGALATGGAAIVGAIVVILQIGHQVRGAISQVQHNEKIRLKLQIYQEVVDLAAKASDALQRPTSYTFKAHLEILAAVRAVEDKIEPTLPTSRRNEMVNAVAEASSAIASLIEWTERWEIIEPRMAVFRIAFHAGLRDLGAAYYERYHDVAMRVLPMENDGVLLPWRFPNPPLVAEFFESELSVNKSCNTLTGYVHDLLHEMQVVLLGELFDNRLSAREPIDPTVKVIKLGDADYLRSYFYNETPWGADVLAAENSTWQELNERVTQ